GWHVPKDLLQLFMTRPFRLDGMPALGEAWRSGRAAWSSDVRNDPGFAQAIFEDLEPHAVLFAPTMAHGAPVGAVFLIWWGAGRVLNPRPLSSAERRGLASLVAESGRSIRTDDYLGECRRRGVEAGQSPVPMRHWIGVPMLAGTQVVGVLALRSVERRFTEDD